MLGGSVSRSSFVFTSESVSEGHPDKVCDRISDEIVDLFYRESLKQGASEDSIRIACETLATTNTVILAGEYRSPVPISQEMLQDTVRQAVLSIGYEQEGFNWKTLNIQNFMHKQSSDIAQGVDTKEEGAGDQGIMFGYACTETPELMPAPIHYAHKILKRLAEAKSESHAQILGPDAKSQVTAVYENEIPIGISQIVLSHQHLDPKMTSNDVQAIVKPYILEVLPENWISEKTKWYINPTGRFYIGGPDGDTGLTGRKIIVDTYGGAAPHGGGAFSGKDPTKVDRSAAYAARYLAKNIVSSGIAKRCTLQLSYAIGVSQPLSIYASFHGTGIIPEDRVEKAIPKILDLSPKGIRKHLSLNRPIYATTAAYGHFGRSPQSNGSFSWEKTDLVEQFKELI